MQRARETKVGKWIERAICKEGQMMSVMLTGVGAKNTLFAIDAPSDEVLRVAISWMTL